KQDSLDDKRSSTPCPSAGPHLVGGRRHWGSSGVGPVHNSQPTMGGAISCGAAPDGLQEPRGRGLSLLAAGGLLSAAAAAGSSACAWGRARCCVRCCQGAPPRAPLGGLSSVRYR